MNFQTKVIKMNNEMRDSVSKILPLTFHKQKYKFVSVLERGITTIISTKLTSSSSIKQIKGEKKKHANI